MREWRGGREESEGGEEGGRRVREWRGGREESEGMERREGGE